MKRRYTQKMRQRNCGHESVPDQMRNNCRAAHCIDGSLDKNKNTERWCRRPYRNALTSSYHILGKTSRHICNSSSSRHRRRQGKQNCRPCVCVCLTSRHVGTWEEKQKRGWHAQACACVRVVLLGRANKFSSDKQSHFERGRSGKKRDRITQNNIESPYGLQRTHTKVRTKTIWL